MARVRLVQVLVLCLLGLFPRLGNAQTAFHGVGDLPGGPSVSVIYDATRSGGVIYAVGASAQNAQVLCSVPTPPANCVQQFNADTPVVWTWDGTNGMLASLPNTAGVNSISAWAITRDASYIASQLRLTAGGATAAVRVTQNGLSNLNLTAAPFPILVPSTLASSISNDGTILYGLTGNPGFRAYRFNVSTSTSTLIPLPGGTLTANSPAVRGTSADGAVMVGNAFPGVVTGRNGRAFRYVHAEPVGTVSLIPLLDGGTWNYPVAVTADGNLTVVAGDNADYPNGELYFHNALTGEITPLGSPNTPWSAQGLGGITSDGAVVAATFFGDAISGRHAYIHNGHGWFNLATALAGQGVDITQDGWDVEGMTANGISPDGTLVYGSGLHNGNREGFVAEFPAGYLASFDVPAVPVADTSIVGAWTIPDGTIGGIVFMADGTYYQLDANHGSAPAGENTSGFERGRFFRDASTGALSFATLQDTNGDVGLSGANGVAIPVTVSGDTAVIFGEIVVNRVTTPSGSIVGAWRIGDARFPDNSGVLMLMADGTFVSAVDAVHHDGIESGTYVVGAGTVTFTSTLDTSVGGLTVGPGTSATFAVQRSTDDLHLILTNSDGAADFVRIVDPQTVIPVVTSALSASGVADQPFTYTVTATHAASFGATGLPDGLTIDSATGVISGAPTAAGTYPIVISATNSFGGTGSATLTLTVAPSKVKLSANIVFTRNVAGQFVMTVIFTNDGNTPATDAVITDVTLNKTDGVPGPLALPRIDPGQNITVVETYPASAGTSGSPKNSFRLKVTWSRGGLSLTEKVTLP